MIMERRDFVVLEEGEVHYWHAVFIVNDVVVFEHQQERLALPHACEGELYRFRLTFVVS